MKPDKIKIEDLEVFANHGVFPEENVLGQKFVVSAVMYTDTRRAGLTDELTASIHYGEASAFITEYLKSHTFKLLEKVAEGLAEEMLVRIAGLQKVQIEIKKPWAPVGLPLKTVSVERLSVNGIRHILRSDRIWGIAEAFWKPRYRRWMR